MKKWRGLSPKKYLCIGCTGAGRMAWTDDEPKLIEALAERWLPLHCQHHWRCLRVVYTNILRKCPLWRLQVAIGTYGAISDRPNTVFSELCFDSCEIAPPFGPLYVGLLHTANSHGLFFNPGLLHLWKQWLYVYFICFMQKKAYIPVERI